MKLQGLIFDMDGTLGDTVPMCIQAIQHTFHYYTGRTFSPAEIVAMFGYSEEGLFQRLLPDTWQKAADMYQAEYEQAHAAFPEPFNGIPALLASLRRRGVQLGIVTGKGPRSSRFSVRTWGLEPYFSGIETGSMDGPVKPHGMRVFLKEWGLPSQAVAYVGDAASDIDAAREVGVLAVSAAWAGSTDAEALAACQPDALFTRVEDFALWLDEVTQ